MTREVLRGNNSKNIKRTRSASYGMDTEKVLNLAKLARVELENGEAEDLSHEFDAILDYVGEVKKADVKGHKSKVNIDKSHLHNVLREDREPHETGLYTKKILEQAPSKEGNYIKVKKIL